MSWLNMNNVELQAIRKILMLEVTEAADVIGNGVSSSTWQRWESGSLAIPDEIQAEIYSLCQMRETLLGETFKELYDKNDGSFNAVGTLRYYSTLKAFLIDYPESNHLCWRLHQSVCSSLFAEGGDVELSTDIPLDKRKYIYKWFSFSTPEQLEHKRIEALINSN